MRTAREAKKLAGLAIGLLLCGAVAGADPLLREQVPEPLRPWVDWVMRGHEDAACPFFEGGDRRQCTWPARLVLDLDERGGRFTQVWRVHRDARVALPGDTSRWPQDLRVDGKPAPATLRDGVPTIRLATGRHEVSGSFVWAELPELLRIPADTGLVALTLEGTSVPIPRRDPLGQLWLKTRKTGLTEEARLDVRVFRRLTDGVPVELATRIELRVSGRNREALLGRALPEGFVPMALDTPLPARIEPDGRLRVQLRPGAWTLEILARHDGPVESLAVPASEGTWAPEEIWVFEARPEIRLMSLEGVPAIDPQQTELPPEWKNLPAYPMRAGSTLRLVEKRRGDAEPAPDQLTLRRSWWLDFDGRGYTIRDDVSGTLSRSWRLEMPPPAVLGRVAIAGRDRLITRGKDARVAGVEIREGQVALEADSRLDGPLRGLPAVGWSQDFQQVSGILNLPPGWRLFHASGIDAVSSTWVTDWTLLDLFLVLIVAMAAWRIWGLGWGFLALVTLGLTYLEPGAPRWSWLALLAGEALLAVLPAGRLRGVVRAYRLAVVISLVLIAIPFAANEIRCGMYPALEYPLPFAPPPVVVGGVAKTAGIEEREEVGELDRMPQMKAARPRRMYDALAGSAPPASPREDYRRVDEKLAISTGPGLPRWQWRTIALNWHGPVEHDQQIRLVLVGPRVNFSLAFVRVALLALLMLKALRAVRAPLPVGTGALAAAAISLVILSAGSGLAADFPPADLLKALEERLLERSECAPSCASSPRLRLEATANALVIRAEVDAAAQTAVPLPGGARSWTPAKIALDGEAADAIVEDEGGILWLAVAPGKHQVLLEGPLANLDAVDIPLPLKPHRVEAKASGWTIVGIHEDGIPDDSIRLLRERRSDRAEQALEPTSLPPFARLERNIHLGLSWEIETVVTRVTPPGTAFGVEVPLLAGESVTTGDVRVENGKALVVLGPAAVETRWRSILKEGPAIAMTAARSVPWTEVWRLDAEAVWHVDVSGIPPIHLVPGPGRRLREWRPWPGETVTVGVVRPEGFPGQTLTIDHTALEASPGRRSSDVTLAVEIRSSRGGQHSITLPEDAELLSVSVNGATQPIRQDKRVVTVPITPGAQTIGLVWRVARGIGSRLHSPEVDLGAASVNAETTIHMPADRWTLIVGGGRLGPVVLFWSILFVVLLLSIALGRMGTTPLGSAQWFLLGVGLTQAPTWVGAIVAGWLLALGWRQRSGAALSDNRFNLVQVVLALWTAAALAGLFLSIEQGLLGFPEMQISGNGSSSELLRWYHDRADSRLPVTWVVSVPLGVYRLAMLAWALWIAWALVSWLRWGFTAFATGGLWRASARAWRLSRRPPPPTTV